MKNKSRQRGEGQFGCLIGLVLLLAAAMVAYKMIPIKVKAAEMRDTVVDEAKSAGQHNDKRMTEAMLAKAAELELPLEPENIEIVRKSGEVRVSVEYTVPVEFPGYVYQWHFKHQTTNPIF
jgi:hypothetical protein